jgi:hypothetical protein
LKRRRRQRQRQRLTSRESRQQRRGAGSTRLRASAWWRSQEGAGECVWRAWPLASYCFGMVLALALRTWMGSTGQRPSKFGRRRQPISRAAAPPRWGDEAEESRGLRLCAVSSRFGCWNLDSAACRVVWPLRRPGGGLLSCSAAPSGRRPSPPSPPSPSFAIITPHPNIAVRFADSATPEPGRLSSAGHARDSALSACSTQPTAPTEPTQPSSLRPRSLR